MQVSRSTPIPSYPYLLRPLPLPQSCVRAHTSITHSLVERGWLQSSLSLVDTSVVTMASPRFFLRQVLVCFGGCFAIVVPRQYLWNAFCAPLIALSHVVPRYGWARLLRALC